MEKLIKLLNEYAKVLGIWDYVWWHKKETVENSAYIFTKKFWFIEWLVENDKIKDYYEWNDDIDYVREKYWFYESLLMLLAISDTPIDLLCEILKDE